jgi:ribonuclease HII
MIKPTFDIEDSLRNQGYRYIVGADEVGRGPLAGPVVAAAVHIPEGFYTQGINDSKKVSYKTREVLSERIKASCPFSIHSMSNEVIDQINILEATKLAISYAVRDLTNADFAIVDGKFTFDLIPIPHKCIISGDSLSLSIAAASIIAKVHRDYLMEALHVLYPVYNWKQNKGYGTAEHMEAIAKYGITPYHRKTFGGVAEYVYN